MKVARLLAGAVCVCLSASVAHGWYDYLDGSAIPSGNWLSYAEEGQTVVIDFWDPEINAVNKALQINSWGGANEWYQGPTFAAEATIAARFKISGLSPTGMEDILMVTVGGGTSANMSITVVDSRFKLFDYTAGSEVLDLGPVVVDQLHTAYLYSNSDGTAEAWWDGTRIFQGPWATAGSGFDGYVEFGAGSWQKSGHTFVDFDWVGYGNKSDLLPEPITLIAFAAGLGIFGARRRK